MTRSSAMDRSTYGSGLLEAGRNFRDLGGHVSEDGSVVRSGLVFRAAALTPDDDERLLALGIRMVVDLRSTRERTARPSVAAVESWARDYDASDADVLAALQRSDTTAAGMRKIMAATYRSLLDEQSLSFAELFRLIARGTLPVVFHCAAGKDRTGVAAALLLALLGVPRDQIEQDYLLTRGDNQRAVDSARSAMAQLGVAKPDEEVLATVMDVDEAYLDAMFDEMERRFGDVETYAFRGMGLTAADLAGLRKGLLEDRASNDE